jgi:hypothetical protein
VFARPNVARLVAKNDLDGLIWAAYHKDPVVRAQARQALKDCAAEQVQAFESLLRIERIQSSGLARRTMRNYPQLERLRDGLVATGVEAVEPLLRSFAATYSGDGMTYSAYRDVLWRLEDVDLSAWSHDPEPEVRKLVADAVGVKALRGSG